jgi:uncharacterized metal-binding protein YceD (DUF177 family)
MSSRREYEIAFVGLKPGVHEFSYDIDDKFFKDYPQQEFKNCHGKVRLLLDKKSSFMLLKFEVGGKADITCDRCGNPITKDLWEDFEVLVKMVDNPVEMNDEEEDPDVFYISRGESHINVAGWIYEFVNLSIPTQRLCDTTEEGGTGCNNEVLEMLKKMNEAEKQAENPIWKGLDKFRNI